MSEASTVQKLYNGRARWYNALIRFMRYEQALRRIVERIDIDDVQHMLDLGCGTGPTSRALRRRFPSTEITGLDNATEMLDVYRKKVPDAKTVFGDFNDPTTFKSYPERTPKRFDVGTIDLIASAGAFVEYGDKNRLPYLKNLLRERGKLVIIGVKDNFFGRRIAKRWGNFRTKGLEEMMQACNDAGFNDVERIPIPWYQMPTSITKYAMQATK